MNARLKSGRSAVRPAPDHRSTSNLWACDQAKRSPLLDLLSASSDRRCPSATAVCCPLGTRGARRMILSMRTLGGEVIGGRGGRSPVLRQLAGGVRGQRRLPYLCIERHSATNLMGNDLLADIAAVTDSSPPRCNPRLAKALWFANRQSRRRAGP